MILCYACGIEIETNPHNMCGRCASNKTDLTAGILTSLPLHTCRGCDRYHLPPKSWKRLQWGSKELLLFLLSRNKSLKRLNIIDSNFLYTEESSKRIRLEILILQDGVEQPCTLEYCVQNKQCTECMRAEAKQYWKACVQVRQRPSHRRTFMHLEQLVMAHRAHLSTTNIKERRDGIDFYFGDGESACRLVDFIKGFYGTRTVASNQLISEDVRNNTTNRKFTYSVELLPFCKDDLVYCTHRPLGLGKFLIVRKVANSVTFFDPQSGQSAALTSKQYFINSSKFNILMRSDQFVKYKVVYGRRLAGSRPGGAATEATVTTDGAVLHEVSTRLRVEDDDTVLGYNLRDSNLSMEIDMGCEVLLVRVFDESRSERALESGRLLDQEYALFLEDIAVDDAQLLAQMALTSCSGDGGLSADLSRVQLH